MPPQWQELLRRMERVEGMAAGQKRENAWDELLGECIETGGVELKATLTYDAQQAACPGFAGDKALRRENRKKINEDTVKKVLETIHGMANGIGGIILLGIAEDKTQQKVKMDLREACGGKCQYKRDLPCHAAAAAVEEGIILPGRQKLHILGLEQEFQFHTELRDKSDRHYKEWDYDVWARFVTDKYLDRVFKKYEVRLFHGPGHPARQNQPNNGWHPGAVERVRVVAKLDRPDPPDLLPFRIRGKCIVGIVVQPSRGIFVKKDTGNTEEVGAFVRRSGGIGKVEFKEFEKLVDQLD